MKLNINGSIVEVEDAVLSKAIEEKQESFDIKSEGLVIRSTDDHNAFIENVKKDVGDYKIEIGRKEVLTGLGLEIEGKGLHKSIDKSLEALNAWNKSEISTALEGVNAKPDKKVEELTKDLEILRGNLEAKDNSILDIQSKFDGYKKAQTLTESIKLNMPNNTILPVNKMVKLIEGDIKLDIDENNVVYGIGQDGKPIKDGNLNLVSVEGIMASYFDSNPEYLKSSTGGAGGADSNGEGGKIKFDAFVKQQSELGNSPSSIEFKKEADRMQKDGLLDLS